MALEADSEPMRLAAEGFLNECARERTGGGRPSGERADPYTSERPSQDRIVFRMNRDILDLVKR